MVKEETRSSDGTRKTGASSSYFRSSFLSTIFPSESPAIHFPVNELPLFLSVKSELSSKADLPAGKDADLNFRNLAFFHHNTSFNKPVNSFSSKHICRKISSISLFLILLKSSSLGVIITPPRSTAAGLISI